MRLDRRATLALAALTCVAAVATGCADTGPKDTPTSSAMTSEPGTASARIGELRISNAYIPKPASPDVAAAYFTVLNVGGTADRLTKVSSSVSGDVMAMTETTHGTSGSMTDLGTITIPAHGAFAFVTGHAHLMLQKPDRALKQGDTVTLTLTFQHAGTIRLAVPVVPITGPAGGGSGGGSMPGMNMSGSS